MKQLVEPESNKTVRTVEPMVAVKTMLRAYSYAARPTTALLAIRPGLGSFAKIIISEA
jgi:hypothetical protein